MRQMSLSKSDVPFIYMTNPVKQVPVLYEGELTTDAIRIWAQELVQAEGRGPGSIDANKSVVKTIKYRPSPVADQTLEPTLRDAKVHILTQRNELEDLLAFEADDICIFVYSTAVKDDAIR